MSEKLACITAIKRYFEMTDDIAPNGGRKVEMAELKSLTKEDRAELGELAGRAMGVEVSPPQG